MHTKESLIENIKQYNHRVKSNEEVEYLTDARVNNTWIIKMEIRR